MKRTVKNVDGREYIIEEFNNFQELVRVNNSRELNFTDMEGSSRQDPDNDFHGGTYEEAVEMLCHGWEDEEKVKKVLATVKKIEKTMDVQKMTPKNDIVGYAPIVPLALRGIPQNMINSTRKPKKAKVINLVVEISVSGGTSMESKLEWGAKLIANISNLEKNGYRVRLEVVKAHCERYGGSKVHAMKVLIKSENQPFDIKRMMFPLAHIAMQRRIAWDWYERVPSGERIGGYGTPLHRHPDSSREKIAKQIIGDTENAHFICCMDDIDKALKGVA